MSFSLAKIIAQTYAFIICEMVTKPLLNSYSCQYCFKCNDGQELNIFHNKTCHGSPMSFSLAKITAQIYAFFICELETETQLNSYSCQYCFKCSDGQELNIFHNKTCHGSPMIFSLAK